MRRPVQTIRLGFTTQTSDLHFTAIMWTSKNTTSVSISFFLITIASWITQSGAAQTPMLTTLTSMFSGYYSNFDQYQRDQANNVSAPDKHLWLQFYYAQVEVPALSPAATVYYEQFVNNASTPSRQQILAFTQKTSTHVRMTSYNIVNATRFSSAPDDIEELGRLTLSELSNRPECDALWEQLDVDSFTSYLATPQQCTFQFFGQLVRPEGSRNLTCSEMTIVETFVTVNGSDVVSGSNKPYHLYKEEDLDSCQKMTTPISSYAKRTTRCELSMLALFIFVISGLTLGH